MQKDSTATNNELVHHIIKRFENEKLIGKKIAEGLKINYLRTPWFYAQPKIHKEGNPGGPVISSLICHTHNFTISWLPPTTNSQANPILC